MRKNLAAFSGLLIGALALSACSGGAKGGTAGSGTLAEGKTFTAAIPADPGSLDPFKAIGSITRGLDGFLYATLLSATPDGTSSTGLATSWQADATRATFTLRDGLTCADGTPLSATDVAANISFMADPANASAALGTEIAAGATAVGDDAKRTVTVASPTPDAFLSYNIGALPIVCKTALGDAKARDRGEGATGMYVMSKIEPNSRYTLTRSSRFMAGPKGWDPKAKGQPKTIVYSVVPNETTAVNLLVSGEVNMVAPFGPDLKRLANDTSLFHAKDVLPLGGFITNSAPGRVTADPAVRTALFQGVNLADARKILTGGTGTAMTTLVTMSSNPCKGTDTVTGNLPSFDANAAAKTLDAAGWVKGPDGMRAKNGKKLAIKLTYQSAMGENLTAAMELTQKAWQDLGIDVSLTGMDGSTALTSLNETHDWDVTAMIYVTALPSALVPFFSGPAPKAGLNFGAVQNAEFDAAVAKARTKPGTEGCADWQDAERAVVKHLDYVPYALADRGPYARKATFQYLGAFSLVPTSIRMYE